MTCVAVRAPVTESERNVREHINAAIGQALPASEARLRAQVEATVRASEDRKSVV